MRTLRPIQGLLALLMTLCLAGCAIPLNERATNSALFEDPADLEARWNPRMHVGIFNVCNWPHGDDCTRNE